MLMYDILIINMEGERMYFKRLKDLREDSDLYQKDVAKILDISQQYYSKYELGKFTIPTELLIKLSNYYDVSIDYIVGLTDEKKISKKPTYKFKQK